MGKWRAFRCSAEKTTKTTPIENKFMQTCFIPFSVPFIKNKQTHTFVFENLRCDSMATSRKKSAKVVSSSKSIAQSMNSNFESFACLWLDQSVNTTQDNLETQKELRQVINHLRTFNDMDECEQYIRQITKEKVVLIVSGALGQELVPRLHDLPQFSACYVFCQDQKRNEEWANKYHKVTYF